MVARLLVDPCRRRSGGRGRYADLRRQQRLGDLRGLEQLWLRLCGRAGARRVHDVVRTHERGQRQLRADRRRGASRRRDGRVGQRFGTPSAFRDSLQRRAAKSDLCDCVLSSAGGGLSKKLTVEKWIGATHGVARNIDETVRIELTVPRGLRPQGMTIPGADPSILTALFNLLISLLDTLNPDLSGLVNVILGIDVTADTVTFSYDYVGGLVAGDAAFPITLDVVGTVVGTFTIQARASISGADGGGSGQTDGGASGSVVDSTVSLVIQVNQLTLQQYYAQFRGIIFWATYNETNANQQIPLYEALPGTTAPGSIENRDHRYLMARTILNNIPFDNVSAGIAYMRR